MGLMVDEIIDVVEDSLDIELAGARPGPAGIGGDRRPGHRCAGYRLLADAGLGGLVPRRATAGGSSRAEAHPAGRRQRVLPPVDGADAWCRRLPCHRRWPVRQRHCGCATPAPCSTPSSPTSRCRKWTACSSPAPIRAGGPWAKLPLIAMTAHSDMEHARIGREAGFTDYVAKFEREALVASLRANLATAVHA